MAIFLEQAQSLGYEYPPKNSEAGQTCGEDDAVACQLRIAAHLLGHGEAGHGAGSGEDGNQGHKIHSPEAQEGGQGQQQGGGDEQAGGGAEDEFPAMMGGGAQAETGTQDDEGYGGGGGGYLSQGLQDGGGQVQVYEPRQPCGDGAQDHGIFQDVLAGGPEVQLASPAGLQGHHCQDIVHGHDEGNHHGGHSQSLAAEDVAHQGNAIEDEVAAENGLGDGSPTDRHFLLEGVGGAHAQQKEKEHSQAAKDDELRPEGSGIVCHIEVIEHHDAEENLEHHAVHMVKLFFGQEFQLLHHGADANEDEHGHHGTHGNEKITGHCVTSFVLVCQHYDTDEGRREGFD